MNSLDISLTNGGKKGTVLLGGVDISTAVAGLHLHVTAGQAAHTELQLVLNEVLIRLPDADISTFLDDAATAALTAAGWTPPATAGQQP